MNKRYTLEKLLIALGMVGAIGFGSYDTVEAITPAEAEQSPTLTNSVKKVDQLSDSEDENWYRFTTDGSGHFSVTLALDEYADADDVGHGWDLAIYEKGNLSTPIKEVNGITSAYRTFELPHRAGEFYIKVNASSVYYHPSAAYSIKYDYIQDADYLADYNEERGYANEVSLNHTYKGSLYNEYDEDWVKFELKEDGLVSLNFGPSSDTDVDMMGHGWTVMLCNDKNELIKEFSGIQSNIKFPYVGLEAGVYYAKISASSVYIAPVDCLFDFSVTYKTTDIWEIENGDARANAKQMNLATVYKGNLYHEQDLDTFKFTVKDEGYVNISLSVDPDENFLNNHGWSYNLRDENGSLIYTESGVTAAQTSPKFPLKAGNYYIEVYASSVYIAPVDYVYNVRVDSTKTAYWEKENNDVSSKSTSVQLNKKYYGNFKNSSDVDWYKVSVPAKGSLSLTLKKGDDVNFEELGSGWTYEIYDSNNKLLYSGKDITTSLKSDSLSVGKGTYYVKVTSSSAYSSPGYNKYELSTSYSISKPSVSVSNTSSGIKVKWNKISGVTGYYIYRKSGSDDWKKIGEVTKDSTVSFVDKTAKAGTTYTYTVKGYAKTGSVTINGSYDKTGKKMKRLSQPGLPTLTKKSSGIQASWNKVTGATGYILYRKEGNGSWVKIGTTTKLTLLDKTAKKGHTYVYTVKAYATDGKTTYNSSYNTTGKKITR